MKIRAEDLILVIAYKYKVTLVQYQDRYSQSNHHEPSNHHHEPPNCVLLQYLCMKHKSTTHYTEAITKQLTSTGYSACIIRINYCVLVGITYHRE